MGRNAILQAREKEVSKLQDFDIFQEVPQIEAEGHDIISSRFVDKWEGMELLTSRLCCVATHSSQPTRVTATRAALEFLLAQNRDSGRGGHLWSFLLTELEDSCHVKSRVPRGRKTTSRQRC